MTQRISRRQSIGAAIAGLGVSRGPADARAAPVTLALLHLAPRAGDLAGNRQHIAAGVLRAATLGARLVLTPELALSGYGFRDRIGTDWIAAGQGEREAWAAGLARQAAAVLVLGTPEAAADGRLHNSLVVFGPDGVELGRHRKIAVLRVGSESWSSPGDSATALDLPDLGRVGLFVCADMYSARLVRETAALDVDLLLSGAAWAAGEHGPNGEWERASLDTARPVLVCNRTGQDVLDFTTARSVVAIDGGLAFSLASATPALILVDWHPAERRLSGWRTAA